MTVLAAGVWRDCRSARTLSSRRLADVADAVGRDVAAVDGGLLVGLGGVGQIGEEVRPERAPPAAEPRVEPGQDLLAGVQALLGGPGVQVLPPRQAGAGPPVPVPVQPTRLAVSSGRRELPRSDRRRASARPRPSPRRYGPSAA